MIDLTTRLRFWMSGPQSLAVARAARAYWARVEDWLAQALGQADIRTCTPAALRQHADDRGVTRLPGEAEALWRERVRHAITVSQNSGTRAGLEYILTVYGVSGFTIQERVAGRPWNEIQIALDPAALNGADSTVLDRIFQEWGRVCRRYVVTYYQTSTETIFAECFAEHNFYGVS